MEGEPRSQASPGEEDVLTAFLSRRADLNNRLDETRVAIDTWLSVQAMPPSMSALAELEALLQVRRDAVVELISVHDALMIELINMRRERSGEPVSPRTDTTACPQ